MRDFRENWRSDSHTLQKTLMNFYSQLPYFFIDFNKNWSALEVQDLRFY
jgi:hypothetical protein